MSVPKSTESMYLISGPEISAAEKSLFSFRNDRKAWADRIVARGPVAQPAPCIPNTPLCDNCYKEQIEHDAAIAAQERDKFVKELEKIKGSFKVIELRRSPEYNDVYMQIVELIISLRGAP